MTELLYPTAENPSRVSFNEDGTMWSRTRDEFIIYRDEKGNERGTMQMLVTLFRPAGSPLPPQTIYTDRPFPRLGEL